MGRHNRKGTEYPNAYVFHVEVVQVQKGPSFWKGEIWLGPWCVWRSLHAVETEAAALAEARSELVAHFTVAFGG